MTTSLIALLIAVLFLAYVNGANDNFKGVATLFGSGTANYRTALVWATVTTLAGSLCALLLAQGLIDTFKGKDLVPDAVTTQGRFVHGGKWRVCWKCPQSSSATQCCSSS